MSDETRQHPRSRRRLLKLGLASPLLLPLHAAQASAPIRVGQPSRPGSAPARASTPKAAASGTTAKTRTTAASAAPTKARTAGGIQRTALETPAKAAAASTDNRAIAAVRMWPSREYTRVTFELTQAIPFRARLIDNPNRVILDLEGLEVESKVRELLGKISTNDPFVRQVRVGQFNPETLRIVFDLKQAVAPQLIADANGKTHDSKAASNPKQAGNGKSSAGTGKKAPAPEVMRTFTVVLDPGHGGEDPGATGPMGTHEKTVVLAVAHKVKKLLAKEENLRVVLTRDDDYYVPLGKRVSKARGVRADLFVSIHADAFVKPDARGSSVFVLSNHGASSLGAKWLAHNENRADLIGGVNIKTASTPETASLLMDLYTTSQIRDSKVLAKRVLAELGQIGRLHKASVEQANFAVLRSPDVPSVLVETAFISNPDEEKRLRHPQYQDELARAIARGILDYRKLNPPGPRGKLS